MTFPHQDREFEELLRIVAEKHGLSIGLVEKDYWVTHVLWGLHASGFDLWFKGGTSLSKGFGIIKRFSEDLDLRIDPGNVGGLDLPDPWDGRSKGAVRKRTEYFEEIAARIEIPGIEVQIDEVDERGRGATYKAVYPGAHHDAVIESGMRPYVLIEAGRARVTPFVERDVSSFVHDALSEQGHTELLENVPRAVRCLHPLVTLLEKLDAISRRFERSGDEAAFARHYEDAAQIISASQGLPGLDRTPGEIAAEMLDGKEIRAIPDDDDEAFSPDADRMEALKAACDKIQRMFWGDRVPVADCCGAIRGWIRENLRFRRLDRGVSPRGR